MESFGDTKSWGTAYKTFAEVLLLLRVGKQFKMTPNYACGKVSTGRFCDCNKKREISIQVLGSCMNGQSIGTWNNKLTFFFHVHRFLAQTKEMTEESMGKKLWAVRQAMADWGGGPQTSSSFLPFGDERALGMLTPTLGLIRRYVKKAKD